MDEHEYRHMYQEEELHWWYQGMRALVQALLPPALIPPGSWVLDAGCGTGFNMGWFQRCYGVRVVGVDIHSTGLDFCRQRGEKDLVCGDVAELPFEDARFDLVASFDVLSEVIDRKSRAAALREFQRVLKPGGRLLLRVPAYEWLRSSHDDGVSTRHRFGCRELEDAVSRAGFLPERATPANILLFPAAVLWRTLKRAGWAPSGSDVRAGTRGNAWVNRTLLSALRAEAAILRRSRVRFPFGLSIFLLAANPLGFGQRSANRYRISTRTSTAIQR